MRLNDPTATPPPTPSKGLRGLWLFLVAAAAAWLASPFVLRALIPTLESRGVFGDSFGAMNALFSGLAFAGVVYAILQQNESRDQQARALEQQAVSLKQQGMAVRQQAEALRIQQQELRLQLDEMRATREEMRKQVDAAKEQAAAIEAQRRAMLLGAAITLTIAERDHSTLLWQQAASIGSVKAKEAAGHHEANIMSAMDHLVDLRRWLLRELPGGELAESGKTAGEPKA